MTRRIWIGLAAMALLAGTGCPKSDDDDSTGDDDTTSSDDDDATGDDDTTGDDDATGDDDDATGDDDTSGDDGDGYTVCEDCDDGDPLVSPGEAEALCNGVDDDCDPATDDAPDDDGDGATVCDDCDDADGSLNLDDADGDGWTTCDGDCDDGDPDLEPADLDGDGYSPCDDDCDDDDVDLDPADADGDGWSSCDGDCDDANEGFSINCEDLNCDGDGLIHTVPDGCMHDGGVNAGGDSLEVYCYWGVARFCLSGESCQWRSGQPGSDDGTTCERAGLTSDYMANAWCDYYDGHADYNCTTAEDIYF